MLQDGPGPRRRRPSPPGRLLVSALNLLLLGAPAGPALAAPIALVSHAAGSSTTGGNAGSFFKALSADGRMVLSESHATDLVGGFNKANGSDFDVFLHNAGTGVTTLVSHAASSPLQTGNGASYAALSNGLSADGRVVLFESQATDLVTGFTDGNAGTTDVFLYDVAAGTTTLVSRASGSATTGGNGGSHAHMLSADGRRVLFYSDSTDLVAGFVDNNGTANPDVFLYDRGAGTITLVTHVAGNPVAGGGGRSLPIALSADGRFVLFESSFGDDLLVGFTDHNGPFNSDLFLYDAATGTTTLVSRTATDPLAGGAGEHQSPDAILSADGRTVVFASRARDLVAGFVDQNGAGFDVFRHDATTGATTLVSHVSGAPATGGDRPSLPVAVSADGRLVLFGSLATLLVPGFVDGNGPGEGDTFLYDADADTTSLISRAAASAVTSGSDTTFPVGLSADGTVALVFSLASDLVPGFVDGNGRASADVFLRDRVKHATRLISHTAASPVTGSNAEPDAALSGDGRAVVFGTQATDVVAGFQGPASVDQVYLWRLDLEPRLPGPGAPIPRSSAVGRPAAPR